MNRELVSAAGAAFGKNLVKGLLAATLAVSGLASAQQAAPAGFKADAQKGGQIYDNGDPARGLPSCASCHGAAGNSTIVANPKLSGQADAYTYKQLVDFTTPQRQHPVMSTYAKLLTDEEKRHLGAFLANTTPKQGAARNKDSIDLGKKIYRGGNAASGVAACASCHGANGGGIPAQYPRLAGQHQDYTIAQLNNFRSGARSNSVQMTALAKRMSDEEIKAVADYIAGLK
jgi:cytochrome c553